MSKSRHFQNSLVNLKSSTRSSCEFSSRGFSSNSNRFSPFTGSDSGSADESITVHSIGMKDDGKEHLSREERRRRRRATPKYRSAHASRERVRVEAFNSAFAELRNVLRIYGPPDKRLSKIEILRLAICYIAYLNHVLES